MEESRGEHPPTVVPVQLPGGPVVLVEARALGGEERAGASLPSFEDLTGAVEGIAAAFGETMSRVQPRRGSVEFGIEIGIESGRLTALLVQGTGRANLKITLEWGS